MAALAETGPPTEILSPLESDSPVKLVTPIDPKEVRRQYFERRKAIFNTVTNLINPPEGHKNSPVALTFDDATILTGLVVSLSHRNMQLGLSQADLINDVFVWDPSVNETSKHDIRSIESIVMLELTQPID
jgi:hypothetical protein